MEIIHKIAAMVFKDDSFLMVRKKGKDVWTNLGGKPEKGETEEQTLLREIKEEVGCDAKIICKLGDFEAPAAMDDAIVRLSTYQVELLGKIDMTHDPDEELEEFGYIGKDYKSKGLQLPVSITEHVIPFCVRKGLLQWK